MQRQQPTERHDVLQLAAVVDAICEPSVSAASVLGGLRQHAPDAFSDPRLLTTVLAKLGRHGRTTTLLDACEWMRSAGVLDKVHYNTALRGLLGSQCLTALRLLRQMHADGLVPNRVSYTAALSALASGAQWEAAAELLQEMQAAGIAPDVAAYSLVIDAMARGGQAEPAVRLLREMQAERFEPDVVAFCSVISAAGRLGEWDRTWQLWDELQGAHAMGSEQALVELLAGSQPVAHRSRVLSACGAACCALERSGQWERALRLFSQLRAAGIAADAATYNAAIRALGRAAPWLWPLQLQYYDEMVALALPPDADAHSAALRELLRTERHAARVEAVRRAARSACQPLVGEPDWPPLRHGQLGGTQTKGGHIVASAGGRWSRPLAVL